ncbi:MAG TPA: fumarylacetoacetate hydrolase family protein [Myxococcaceae bacterium]|nr:fumarylacetoacetate hydrolase family protein [Myxococcaceae bacterium]
MATHLARYAQAGRPRWGVVRGERLAPLEGDYPTTAALIQAGEGDWRAAARRSPSVELASVTLLSPVTAPARVICQGANYRQHMIESGLDPDAKRFNMFFEKSDASIGPPVGSIVRPPHVRLLDYELELALVFRKAISKPVTVTTNTLHEHVFGVTMANDVSARDVQLPETQFFKGKSYRGFCPLGPYLAVLEPDEIRSLDQLTLTLKVNDTLRQSDSTANLVYKPAETITELSTFSDLSPGDVLLTGTPAGCALRAPPRAVRKLMQLVLSEPQLWATFVRMQAKRPEYLRPGDVVRGTISSSDGAIDLGEQRLTVEGATA